MKKKMINFSIKHYKLVTLITILIALLGLSQFPFMTIDTDPENMLSENEFIRVFDRKIKKEFNLYDIIVLGIVNEENSDGVFNKDTLTKIYKITNDIKKIEIKEKHDGILKSIDPIVDYDMISPSTVDNIQQGSTLGTIKFEWLMSTPPATEKEAVKIGKAAKNNPFLDGTMVSENGKAVCIYIPIKKKEYSYQISKKVKEIIDNQKQGSEKYYITGLPVAEDTFGVEMFKQMAISAPIAGLIIFILMWIFFRNIKMIISPMIVACVSIFFSMGLLIATGNTIHIMSSMIAIFLMPIAVVDSVHIISDFFEKYQIYKDKRKTISRVVEELFQPMLYTSLTSTVGFVSLATAPIPPVQIFGIFVGVGIMTAWILTMTFVPASIMFISDSTLQNFGKKVLTEKSHKNIKTKKTVLGSILTKLNAFIFKNAKLIIGLTIIISVLAVIGITKININDNPVKWFDEDHNIRISDKVLNHHFGGTYMAYLVFETEQNRNYFEKYNIKLHQRYDDFVNNYYDKVPVELNKKLKDVINSASEKFIEKNNFKVKDYQKAIVNEISKIKPADDAGKYFMDDFKYFMDDEKVYATVFKQPEMLQYIDDLQTFMNTTKVGKSNSLTTIVKKVYLELMGGDKQYFKIPDSSKKVGECLIQFQNSHRPNDLWHFTNTDYNKAIIAVQLKSGDNQVMTEVENKVSDYIMKHPVPYPVKTNWAGLNYINVVWQDKMVKGMLHNSLLSSYIAVLIMMIFLFRSLWYGILSMVPLTVTIAFIYGFIGFIGKDYDMPVAILSSLTLGMAVDFAIHFLERFREIYNKEKNLKVALNKMFDEPATAISRNIIVIALGFLPLLLSPLVPYQTVGFFLSAIMIIAGIGTLIILPAVLKDIIRDFKPEK